MGYAGQWKDTERRRTLILRQIIHQWNEREKADNVAVSVAVNMFRLHWDKNDQVSYFFFGRAKFTHTQYIWVIKCEVKIAGYWLFLPVYGPRLCLSP